MIYVTIATASLLLATLFGAFRDGKFGKVDKAFLLAFFYGAIGCFCAYRGVGLEFSMKITPLETMALVNLILSGLLVFLPVFFMVFSMKKDKISAFNMGLILSAVGYIFLPSFAESVFFFISEDARIWISSAIFVAILLLVQSIAKDVE